jgi:hypothetical protein
MGIRRDEVSDIEVALRRTSLIAREGVMQPRVRAESTESQTIFLAQQEEPRQVQSGLCEPSKRERMIWGSP